MKNKKVICITLAIMILALTAFTWAYYVMKTRSIDENTGYNMNLGKDSEEIKNPSVIMVDSFASFNKYINNEDGKFIVFGKENCEFCTNYKPVLEQISTNYGVEIVYVNMSKLSSSDYQNVMNTDITIPGKCNKEGADIKLKAGFGTPLGLFIKKGATYDCIRGYNDYSTMEILLKTIGYI